MCFSGRSALKWVGMASLATFFVSLAVFYLLSDAKDFNGAEIRRAIAITFVATYFLLIAVLPEKDIVIAGKHLSEILFSRFDYIILAVIAFYFGGRSVENAAGIYKQHKIEKKNTT